MAYSKDEYREIRAHINYWLRQSNMFRIIDEASEAAREQFSVEDDLHGFTIGYVKAVATGLNRNSRETYNRALIQTREFVTTESGSAISAISVVATPEDRELLGFDELDLNDAPDVRDLVRVLDEIVEDLEQNG